MKERPAKSPGMGSTGTPAPLGRVAIITGNYGSGKTEVAVNWALALAAAGTADDSSPVTLVDLDIANPYFRSREAAELLRAHGINVVVPPGEQMHADLPIILPQIKGLIQQSEGQVLLDVGGDDVGARVLASFAGSFGDHEMLQVVNAFRPFTDTLAGCLQIMDEIQAASHLTVTGLISNAHLMDETSVDTILEGAELARRVAEERDLTLRFVTAPLALVDAVAEQLTVPVLPIDRRMLPPWMGEANTGVQATTQSRRGQDRFGLLTAQASQTHAQENGSRRRLKDTTGRD
jgi:hypothetical protein